MNSKERFEACLKLAEHAQKNFHTRREFEWKVTLAYWALLVAAIASTLHAPIEMAKLPHSATLFGVWISVLLYAFFWLRGTWVASQNDKLRADHFFNEAEQMIHSDEKPRHGPPKVTRYSCEWCFGFLGDWAPIFQLMTSIGLASVLCFVLP
jgi:hypothetical protein